MKCNYDEIDLESAEQKLNQNQDLLEINSNSEQRRHRRQTDKLNRQEGCKNHNEIFVLIITFLDFGS